MTDSLMASPASHALFWAPAAAAPVMMAPAPALRLALAEPEQPLERARPVPLSLQ